MKLKNIIKYINKGIFWEKVNSYLLETLGIKLFDLISWIFPVNQKKIVFINFNGGGYGDNPKYIAQYIIEHDGDFELVWLIGTAELTKTGNFPKKIRFVKIYSYRALYELSTAGTWINNVRSSFFPTKKKKQIYIQTWHGGLWPLKKMEKDNVFLNKSYIKKAKKDSDLTDYIISGCKERTELFKRAFWFDHVTVLEIGIPRCDILLMPEPESTNLNIIEKYKFPEDTLVVLYAPTFRPETDDLFCYELDFGKIREAFLQYFRRDKVALLLRMHPNVTHLFDNIKLPDFVRNVSSLPDMQELLLVADVLITDYSDTSLEFMLMKKPVFLFALDYDDYINKVGFYHNFDELPFPLAKSNKELIENIKMFDLGNYKKRISLFMKEKYFFIDGNASKRVYELIKNTKT
jgi:CDP-glycerol glycerophosphotransferase